MNLVKERYPGAKCEGFVDTGDADSYPGVCSIPRAGNDMGRGLVLFFGLDPDGEEVRSIWLYADSWETIKRVRQR